VGVFGVKISGDFLNSVFSEKFPEFGREARLGHAEAASAIGVDGAPSLIAKLSYDTAIDNPIPILLISMIAC